MKAGCGWPWCAVLFIRKQKEVPPTAKASPAEQQSCSLGLRLGKGILFCFYMFSCWDRAVVCGRSVSERGFELGKKLGEKSLWVTGLETGIGGWCSWCVMQQVRLDALQWSSLTLALTEQCSWLFYFIFCGKWSNACDLRAIGCQVL